MFPGPTVVQPIGHQTMIRFNNKVDVDAPGNPYGAVERPWGIDKELHNLCAERKSRTGNPNPGTGRALSVHHHGMTSLAPFDGWAEDVHCYGEQKDYILPGSRAATFWYHDHALATTSENTYAGLEGVHVVEPCQEPYNLQRVPQYVVHYLDATLNKDCQLVYQKSGAHFNNIFGDVNLVNGVAWPVLTVQPRYVRFHVLNGGVSRALSLNFQDANGKKYNDRCRIVGSDGGVIGKDRTGTLGGRPFPTRRGLFTSNAYRWDIVCDFRNLEGALFLTNEPNEDLMEPVPPMFCNSHLLMRIDITTTKNPSESLFPHKVDLTPASFNSPAHMADYSKLPEGETVVDTEVGAAALKKAARKALDGDADRRLHFKKQGDYWVVDNLGWEHNVDDHHAADDADDDQTERDGEHGTHLIASDVGQNSVEVWELRSGGGWVHPVHAHLIEWYVLAFDGKPVEKEYPEFWRVPKDVFQVGASVRKVAVAARYGPSLGRYMVHCHNGVHEDRDMMVAFSVVPPHLGLRTARGTGFDADIAELFNNAGGDYSNGDLNARYGDRFYPAEKGKPGSAKQPQTLALMDAAAAWHEMGFYSSFYSLDIPGNVWAVNGCAA